MKEIHKRIYWFEEFDGKCQGGFFTRCNLKENIRHFEEKGCKVIGIKCSEDSDWNLEFICVKGSQTKHNAKAEQGVEDE